MSLTLLALGLLHWWRNGRSGKTLACLLIPAGVLVAAYAITIHSRYHTWVITAPFSNGILFHFAPGPSILANLFDTSRGLLPNNPAYLLILVGLPIWWKRDRNSALITLTVLLPSLLLQSTFADWAGGMLSGRRALSHDACLLRPSGGRISLCEAGMAGAWSAVFANSRRSRHRCLQHAHGF